MTDKIVRKYNLAASGILSIDTDGMIYLSLEDGIQDISLADLLEAFDGKHIKLSCSYDEEYGEDGEIEE